MNDFLACRYISIYAFPSSVCQTRCRQLSYRAINYHELHQMPASQCSKLSFPYPERPWQTRTHCCGHTVADTLLPTQIFPGLPARGNICCGQKFVSGTKNVSDFVQKHFVSATNVSQFVLAKKHHGQQYMCPQQVLVYQGFKMSVYSFHNKI